MIYAAAGCQYVGQRSQNYISQLLDDQSLMPMPVLTFTNP